MLVYIQVHVQALDSATGLTSNDGLNYTACYKTPDKTRESLRVAKCKPADSCHFKRSSCNDRLALSVYTRPGKGSRPANGSSEREEPLAQTRRFCNRALKRGSFVSIRWQNHNKNLSRFGRSAQQREGHKIHCMGLRGIFLGVSLDVVKFVVSLGSPGACGGGRSQPLESR